MYTLVFIITHKKVITLLPLYQPMRCPKGNLIVLRENCFHHIWVEALHGLYLNGEKRGDRTGTNHNNNPQKKREKKKKS